MSWTFLYNAPDKNQVIEECTLTSGSLCCIKKTTNGNELWTLWLDNSSGTKSIALFLLARRDNTWGYKYISEASGPYYYKCPLAFLEEAPVQNQSWRDKVLVYHNERKKTYKIARTIRVGQVVTLRDSTPSKFTVIKINPFLGVANGCTYKLYKSRVIDIQGE